MYLHCLEPGHYRDASGRRLERTALIALAAATQSNPPILVLPLRHCLVDELQVAPHELRHLATALPWRFEEQVIAPVESLHFAQSPVQEGKLRVTAVSRSWLTAVLEDLADIGILPREAVCETELMPWCEQEWTLQVQPAEDGTAQGLLRHGWHRALLCHPDNVAPILQALADEAAALPRRIRLCADNVTAAAWRARLPSVMQGLVEIVSPVPPAVLPSGFCNVLQGAYAPRLPWARWWREWRIAAVLLLALFLAEAGMTAAAGWQLHAMNRDLQAAMTRTAAEALPGAEIVDPQLQLRRAVAVAGGSEGSGMLALLTRMLPSLSANPALRIQGLEYDQASGELQLLLESRGFGAVESLRASLQSQGMQAELLGSTSDGNVSRSRLRVRS